MVKFRIEKDSLGEIKVESTKLWGAQTQRSIENFKTVSYTHLTLPTILRV